MAFVCKSKVQNHFSFSGPEKNIASCYPKWCPHVSTFLQSSFRLQPKQAKKARQPANNECSGSPGYKSFTWRSLSLWWTLSKKCVSQIRVRLGWAYSRSPCLTCSTVLWVTWTLRTQRPTSSTSRLLTINNWSILHSWAGNSCGFQTEMGYKFH